MLLLKSLILAATSTVMKQSVPITELAINPFGTTALPIVELVAVNVLLVNLPAPVNLLPSACPAGHLGTTARFQMINAISHLTVLVTRLLLVGTFKLVALVLAVTNGPLLTAANAPFSSMQAATADTVPSVFLELFPTATRSAMLLTTALLMLLLSLATVKLVATATAETNGMEILVKCVLKTSTTQTTAKSATQDILVTQRTALRFALVKEIAPVTLYPFLELGALVAAALAETHGLELIAVFVQMDIILVLIVVAALLVGMATHNALLSAQTKPTATTTPSLFLVFFELDVLANVETNGMVQLATSAPSTTTQVTIVEAVSQDITATHQSVLELAL
jgi:hypothetical protein